MEKSGHLRYRNILRILGIAAALVYVVFLVSEFTGGIAGTNAEIFTTFALFLLFLSGFYYLWSDERLSGFMWIIWYAFLLIFVRWVWVAAGVTVIMGVPILILGLLLFIYGMRHKRVSA